MPSVPDVFAAFFAAEPEAGPDQVVFGPCDRTFEPEAALGHDYDVPEPEPEPEAEWDSADSNAYQARVEAGLEPEAEP